MAKDFFRVSLHNYLKGSFKYCPLKSNENKQIIVLGNGPSASPFLEKLSTVTNVEVFALNDFSISPYFTKIKPKYYLFLDPGYWLSPEKTNIGDVQMREKVMNAICQGVNWEMTVFIPRKVDKGKIIPQLYQNNNLKIAPFDDFYISLRDNSFLYYCLKKNLATPFNNVLAAAIYFSINMGFKKIGVMGADHSWTKDLRVNDNNEVCTIKRHFFDDGDNLVPWLTSTGVPYKMSKILEDLRKTFLSYELLSKYANSFNVRIINYSKGSFIDSFERRNFNEVFE